MKTLLVITLLSSGIIAAAQQSSQIPEKYYPKPKISAYEVFLGLSTFSIIGYQPPQASPTGSDGYGYFITSLEVNKSFSVAVGACKQLNEHFEVKALLFYAVKSYTEKLDSIRYTSNRKLESITFVRSEQPSNQYVTLQILPQYLVGRKIKCNFGLGGYLSKLVGSQTEVRQAAQPNYTYNSSPAFNSYDYGLSLNLGVSHSISKVMEISLQLFASQGISNISDFQLKFNYPSWYYRSYSIMLGLRFLKSKRLKL
jgi:hypothetical protein